MYRLIFLQKLFLSIALQLNFCLRQIENEYHKSLVPSISY